MLDNKANRQAQKWKDLADQFMNNLAFSPTNPFTSTSSSSANVVDDDLYSRIKNIDPSQHPLRNYTGEEVKSCFNDLKKNYTLYISNFNKSGNLEDESDHRVGDEIFYVNFCRDTSPIFLYMFLLFDRSIPSLLSREAPGAIQLEEGVSGGGGGGASSSLNRKYELLDNNDNKKVKHIVIDLTEEERAKDMAVKDSFIARDAAIAAKMVSETIALQVRMLREDLLTMNPTDSMYQKMEEKLKDLRNQLYKF